MSKQFVRNITDTVLTGKNKEPFYTNIQNDILSDNKDCYIRNRNEYYPITKGILDIKSNSKEIKVSRYKNNVTLTFTGEGGHPSPGKEYDLISKSKYLEIEKKEDEEKTSFILSCNELELKIDELERKIKELEEKGSDFLGDFHEYDFEYITDNETIKDIALSKNNGYFITLGNSITKDIGKIKINIPKDLETLGKDFLTINTENNFMELGKTQAKNIYIDFINSDSNDFKLRFNDVLTVIGYPKTENDIDYIKDSIILKGNDLTSIHLTVYTDPTGKVIRSYVKELKK